MGEGTVEGRKKGPDLPRGITEPTPLKNDEPTTLLSQVNDIEQGVAEYTSVEVTIEVEGLDPTYKEVRECPDWPKWEQAIQTELANLKEAGTWTVGERRPNRHV